MATRSFILEGTDKRFWDVTYEDSLVEITFGKWGANGRARSASFSSLAERDAFISREVQRIQKKGYVESAVIAPAAESAPSKIERAVAHLVRLIESTKRPAWLPVFKSAPADAQGTFGRVRGAMTLDPDEPWPSCPVCKQPLVGLFELDRSELPSAELRDDNVVQLFWCEAWENRQPNDVVCTAAGGWMARAHARGPHRRTLNGAPATTTAIVGWDAFEELAVHPSTALQDALDAANLEVVESLVAVTGATSEDDDLYNAIVAASPRRARTSNKLGGWPVFVQADPAETGLMYTPLFQIEMGKPFDVNFGDLGAGHLLLGRDGRVHFTWSCH